MLSPETFSAKSSLEGMALLDIQQLKKVPILILEGPGKVTLGFRKHQCGVGEAVPCH